MAGAHRRRVRLVGVQRIRVEPGKWSTPLHLEGSEEEIFYVLGGSASPCRDGSTDEAYAVGPGDCLVHLALEHAHTLQAARTASTCSPSASGATRRTRCCRAPASRGSARPGCSRARPTTIRGSARPPPGRPRSASSRSGRRGSSTSPTSAGGARRGDGRSRVARSRPRRRLDKTGLRHFDVRPGQAGQPAALPLRRGGDLRRARRRGQARALAAPPAAAASSSARGAPRDVVARPAGTGGRTPSAPGRRAHPARLRDARPATTSPTTRARQGELPRRRPHRPPRRAGLLGRRGLRTIA